MTHNYAMPTQRKFTLGNVYVTPAAERAIASADITVALVRHTRGDWGDVGEDDRAQNERALREGGGLMSVFHDRTRAEFWIVTESDRSTTTVLLPDDY